MLWSELLAKMLLARVINNYYLVKFVFPPNNHVVMVLLLFILPIVMKAYDRN